MIRGALSVLCVLGVGACHADKTQSVVEPRSDAEDATDSVLAAQPDASTSAALRSALAYLGKSR